MAAPAIEGVLHAVVIVDRAGKVTHANRRAEALFARTDLVGVSVGALVPRRLRAKARALFAWPPQAEADLLVVCGDAREVPVELVVTPYQNGKSTLALCTLIDRSAERELELAYEHLRSIVESSDEAIIGKTLDGIITSWNRGAVRTFGFTALEAVGSSISLIIPPGREGEEPTILEHLKAGTGGNRFETVRRRKDGRDIDVLVTVSPIRNNEGEVIGASKIARDITEKKRADERFRLLFEWAPDAMVMIDQSGEIRLVNGAAERVFGYQRAELIGEPVMTLLGEGMREGHADRRRAYFDKPITGYVRESIGRHKSGVLLEMEASVSPLLTVDGPVSICVFRDVTNRKLLERRIQDASRAKSNFLANMSHELRTPLNAIIGFADLMHRGRVGPVSDEHHEYLGDILTSARHLLQLINDVLDLAKVESGKIELRAQPVDVAQIVSEVRDIVRGLATSKQISLRLELADAPPGVNLDPGRLKQILYNYLSNAIKFTSEEEKVTLRVSARLDDRSSIHVIDSGAGISETDQKKLFVEFQQLDTSAGKRFQGTGLGLALTKRIAEAMGGAVGVSSRVGKGSTFWVELPRTPIA